MSGSSLNNHFQAFHERDRAPPFSPNLFLNYVTCVYTPVSRDLLLFPLSRGRAQANMTVHIDHLFTCIQAALLVSPLPRHSRRDLQRRTRTDTPLRYDKVHSRPCWVSCLLCISHDAAPGRCRRPPALRALELLPAIHTALEAAPMLSKELHQPR